MKTDSNDTDRTQLGRHGFCCLTDLSPMVDLRARYGWDTYVSHVFNKEDTLAGTSSFIGSAAENARWIYRTTKIGAQ